jgi:hypothetical protein
MYLSVTVAISTNTQHGPSERYGCAPTRSRLTPCDGLRCGVRCGEKRVVPGEAPLNRPAVIDTRAALCSGLHFDSIRCVDGLPARPRPPSPLRGRCTPTDGGWWQPRAPNYNFRCREGRSAASAAHSTGEPWFAALASRATSATSATSKRLAVTKAAAGSGQTSPVVNWPRALRLKDGKVSWLSLDATDNEPGD